MATSWRVSSDREPDASPARRLRRFRRAAWQLTAHTLGAAIRYRVTGLAAEAAFFTVLSLPPLIFGLAGAIGFIAQRFDVSTIAGFRGQVLALASRALTQDAVDNVLAPTLDDVLTAGRFEVISIGFVIALWSGSRALNVFVDTITIMYGLGGHRGIVATRALSFGLYVVFLLLGILVIPLVLAGPTLVDQLLPAELNPVASLYWPVVLLSSVFFLATLYHVSVPVRTRLRANLPGALLTLLIWVGGSALLRFVLGQTAGSTSIYGPLAAPIALLIWLYLVSVAVLIGAAFNAGADEVWPRLSGIHPEAESDGAESDGAEPDGAEPDQTEPDGGEGQRDDRARDELAKVLPDHLPGAADSRDRADTVTAESIGDSIVAGSGDSARSRDPGTEGTDSRDARQADSARRVQSPSPGAGGAT